MILRKIISFLIPILLSSLIVYCGMSFTEVLLKKQTDSFLGGKGEIMLPTISEGSEVSDKFDTEELVAIAKSYSENREWLFHDPLNGQLSMDEALRISADTVESFINAGILPYDFQNILSCDYKATLGTKKYQSNSNVIINPQFSWWDINFTESDVLLEIYLNATTGKIMKLTATMGEKQEDTIDFEKFVDAYLNYMEMQDLKYEIQKRDSTVYIHLQDLNLTLVIEVSGLNGTYYSINLFFK